MDKGQGGAGLSNNNAGRRNKLTITCNDWKPLHKNTLCGFARREVSDAFSRAVIAAVCERFPNALALEEASS